MYNYEIYIYIYIYVLDRDQGAGPVLGFGGLQYSALQSPFKGWLQGFEGLGPWSVGLGFRV